MRKTGVVTTNHLNLLNTMLANQFLTDRTHNKSENDIKVYGGAASLC